MKFNPKILFWLPRTLCIAAIFFISLFALDAFDTEGGIIQKLSAFFIHLIPSFILVGILFIAWKWELIGGIIFMAIGIGFTPFIYSHNYQMNHSIGMSLGIVSLITIPFVIIGILFVLSFVNRKNNISQFQAFNK
jgi:hypothetical protein